MKILATICALVGAFGVECSASSIFEMPGSTNISPFAFNSFKIVLRKKLVMEVSPEEQTQQLDVAIDRFRENPSMVKGVFERLSRSEDQDVQRQALEYLGKYKND